MRLKTPLDQVLFLYEMYLSWVKYSVKYMFRCNPVRYFHITLIEIHSWILGTKQRGLFSNNIYDI